MTRTGPAPDDLVRASLHYTDFGDRETFEWLVDAHGLRYGGRDEREYKGHDTSKHLWISQVSERRQQDGIPVDPLTLGTAADPRDEHERHILGEDRTETTTGYASYVEIRGPLSAALELYCDVYEAAEYIKGEFRPLATMDIECNKADGQRVVAIDGANIIDEPDAHGKATLSYEDSSFPEIVWYESANDLDSPAHHRRIQNDGEYRRAHEFDYDDEQTAKENLVRAAKKHFYLNDEDFRRFVGHLDLGVGDEELEEAIKHARNEAEREERRQELARKRAIPPCLRGRWEPDTSRSKQENVRAALRTNAAVDDADLADALVGWLDIEYSEATDWVRNGRSWAATHPEEVTGQ